MDTTLRLIWRSRTFSTDDLRIAVFLDKVDIFMSHSELSLNIYTWLGGEGHAWPKEGLVVAFIQIWTFVSCVC